MKGDAFNKHFVSTFGSSMASPNLSVDTHFMGDAMQYNTDILGNRFGRWTVVHQLPADKCNKKHFYCRCECGIERSVRHQSLINGRSKSCGCLVGDVQRVNRQKRPYEWLYNALVYSTNHRKKPVEMNLTYEEFVSFTQILQCYYCGSFIDWRPYSIDDGRKKGHHIDRIDSNKGYSVDNCVVCCSICNYMKLDYTKKEFIQQCERITLWQQQQNN